MNRNIIFNIQKFCVNDGPGIRTTVFLKGCPLNCIWCHNPESKKTEPQIFYNKEKCLVCGKCAEVCPNHCHTFSDKHEFDRSACSVCGACTEVCMTNALEKTGERQSLESIINEVMKDEMFYQNSNGGMTLSGGEPMFQFDFTKELLQEAKKRGLHTCMETCGFASRKQFEEIAPMVDIFLYDYKETDPEKHKKFTGVRNDLILDNLDFLDHLQANLILRCPIIPSLNDREEHFNGISALANRYHHILEVDVEPYHPLGTGKAVMLGGKNLLDGLSFPEQETVNGWIAAIQSKTKVPVKKA